MAESSEGPETRTGSSTRMIAIAAVLAAILALVVALGLVLRADQGDDNPSVNPMGSDVNGPPIAGADQQAADDAKEFAPPWPARRIGGNCSAGGITAHWRVHDDGKWQCTVTTPDVQPPVQAPAPPPPPPPPPPGPEPAPEPVPVEAPPPPAFEPPPPPPVYEPPAYEPPPPPPVEPPPVFEPEPAPAPPPPPPPPPVLQLPFPLPPILLPPAAAVLP
ncbi:hypothetical protein ACFWPK_30625 [Nocardia sp. NPDC058519]|uniref:hypothetical protein n=1 Tax=unclassified Nocardia TaxID=2637762 RepID=UPI003652D098